MDVFKGLETLTRPFHSSTVAIGTFDGVHVGHQAIIRTAVEDAHTRGCPALVFTFDRHPAELLRPDQLPGYLTTPEQRIKLISELGADALVIARFDHTLSELSPDAFVRTILLDTLGAESIVIGDNFQFGKARAGDAAFLKLQSLKYDFRMYALTPILVGGIPASSTRIRESLRRGDVEEAEAVLGHPYWLQGTVVSGQQLGRTLGYPTANMSLSIQQVVPADGVYAVLARLDDGRILEGACSIGDRPTIEGAGRSIETFLLDFAENIYGRAIELRFVRYLRPELKFDSLDALKVQMAKDVADARTILYHARTKAV